MADFKITRNDELMHYRTKGSRNGVRLYQNPDGSLTPLGERHYRDMYGYGERDGGVSKDLDAKLQRAQLEQTFRKTPARTTPASGGQKSSVSGIQKRPFGSHEYVVERMYNSLRNGHGPTFVSGDKYSFTDAPYVRISGKSLSPDKSTGSTQPAAGGKQTSSASTFSKNASPEYLEELNYNSKKNVYPSNSSQISPQEKRGTPGTAGKPLSSNAWRFGLTDFDVYGQGQQPENVSKKESALKKAYDSATNWVVERADDAKKTATDAYNSASKAVVDTADKVKKGATDTAVKVGDAAKNAYNDASKWVVDRADDVKNAAVKVGDDAKKAATDAYDSASKAVVDTADKVKKGVSDAYDATSKAVVDAADKVKTGATDAYNSASKAVVGAADKAKGALDQAYKDAEKWVTTAADDVKKTASEAFDTGKEWVEQAGKDVGDFVNNAVSDVTKAVDDAKNGVVDAANTVGKAAQDGWNWVKGLFGGGDDYGKDEDKDRSNHSSSSHKM